MSVLSPAKCLLGHHEPQRRSVEWNGYTHVGQCRYCGTAIERVEHKKWRRRSKSNASAVDD